MLASIEPVSFGRRIKYFICKKIHLLQKKTHFFQGIKIPELEKPSCGCLSCREIQQCPLHPQLSASALEHWRQVGVLGLPSWPRSPSKSEVRPFSFVSARLGWTFWSVF